MSAHIHGIGVDLLDERRIAQSLERFDHRFAQKILTNIEFQDWCESGCSVNRMAKYFAAKEAVVKALGTGFRQGITFQQVTMRRSPEGCPYVTLSGAAARRLQDLEGQSIQLSLTDEYPWVHAFALVVN
jgi:holo-[acyl-carrier protein] synthase